MDDMLFEILHDPETFGVRLRLSRKAKGWSQEKLAEEANLSKHTVMRCEQGENTGIDARFRLAEAVGLWSAEETNVSSKAEHEWMNTNKKTLQDIMWMIKHLLDTAP